MIARTQHDSPRAGCGLLISVVALIQAVAVMAQSPAPAVGQNTNLADLDIEALVNVTVSTAAGLTETDVRRVPVPLTTLDVRDIEQSGARDLNQLLEIYVPNVQMINHTHHQPHLGFRGIISDREDKYLYQVNGRTMNNRMMLGADNERSIPLLGDINSVSVVRGPASATHGAGALAGVIDVETYNGLTFQGFDARVREGVVDQYSAAEVRYGRKFTDTSGLFLYYGIADVPGADSDYYIGLSRPAANGLPANVAGHPYRGPMANLGEQGFGQLRHKVHMSYVTGPFELWTRFVQDGLNVRPQREIYTTTRPADVSLEEWTRGRTFEDQQFTVNATFKKDLSPAWNLTMTESYDIWAFKDARAGYLRSQQPARTADEQEVFSRAIARWTPGDAHSLAFGVDYSHEWFYDPWFSDALDRAPVVTKRRWQTDTVSLFAEHQWKISDQWTTFLSFRTDKHTYTDWLLSPRATVVFTPTKKDTFKIMAGQSVRRGGDEELWSQWARQKTIPDPETLRSYELSYERKLTEHWRASVNAFYEDYDAIGWVPSLYQSSSIGRFQMAGGEFQISYTKGKTRVTLSEGLTKLVDASLPSGLAAAGQGITSEPYGYGHDLAEWSPFITKLAIIHDFHKKWTGNASLIYYSGFPGAEDYAKYASTLASPPSAVPRSDPGYTTPYGPNLFVNLGLEYRPTEQWTIRLDGYNLAALADEKLSKRNYYFRLSEFSVQPASLAVSVRYRF